MKIYQIAYKNLFRRKIRSILTIISIALSCWVLLSLLGFNKGYEAALNRDIDNLGYQMLVTAKGCPYEAATLMLKGGSGLRYMSESIVKDITKHTEVESVTKMLMNVVFDPNKGESGGYTAYLGVDPLTFPKMKGYLKFKEGGWFSNPDAHEVVLGYEAAELEQREVGDLYLVPGKKMELKIVGVLKRTGTQDDGTIFLPLKIVQDFAGKQAKLTGVGIKVKKDADINKFEEKIYDLPDVQVVSMAQVKDTIMNLVSTAKVMVLSIAFIAIVIAMVGVINTILMSVLERFQEIGIFKSMGALPRDIFELIWFETLILCLAGGLLGSFLSLLLSQVADFLIRRLLPYAPNGKLILIDFNLFLLTLGIIVLVGILSGIYPAWKASSIKPIEAIQKEND